MHLAYSLGGKFGAYLSNGNREDMAGTAITEAWSLAVAAKRYGQTVHKGSTLEGGCISWDWWRVDVRCQDNLSAQKTDEFL